MKNKLFQKIISTVIIVGLVTCIGLNHSIVKADTDDSTEFWLSLGRNAWAYFEPGNGLIAKTGLPGNSMTDWDLGFYVQAIIDANKIGLISKEGTWGANDRINKVLMFLENRPLMADGVPYIWYSSETYQNIVTSNQIATDTGRLLITLKNLEVQFPEFKDRIDYIVYNRTNYEPLKAAVDWLPETYDNEKNYTVNIYDYYLTYGFADFWPERFDSKLEAIANVINSAPTVNYEGIDLPKMVISSDPLLMAIFEIDNPGSTLMNLSRQVYLAQEARYNATGKYTAFGEGSAETSDIGWVWEWVIKHDGKMWSLQNIVQDSGTIDDPRNTELTIAPIIYFKAAVGFLAIYNTPYAQSIVDYLIKNMPYPSSGYGQGIDENGRVLSSNIGTFNGMIIAAARYSIVNNVMVPLISLNYNSSPTPQTHNTLGSTTASPSTQSLPSDRMENEPMPKPTLGPTITVTPANNNTSKGNQANPLNVHPDYIIMAVVTVVITAIVWMGVIFTKERKNTRQI